jgi:hypothetical protein
MSEKDIHRLIVLARVFGLPALGEETGMSKQARQIKEIIQKWDDFDGKLP